MDKVLRTVLLTAMLIPVALFAGHAIKGQVFVSAIGIPHDADCPDCPGAVKAADRQTGKVHCSGCGRHLFTMAK